MSTSGCESSQPDQSAIANIRLKSVESHLSNSSTNNTTYFSNNTITSPGATSTFPTLPKLTTAMSNSTRPHITAHVLDTTLGRPATSIPVSLMLMPSSSPPPPSPPQPSTYTTPFSSSEPTIIATSITDSDGRVTKWDYAINPHTGEEQQISTERGRVYLLRFETEGYYKRVFGEGSGFFPWIDVVFVMGGGEDVDGLGRYSGGVGGDAGEEGERKHYHVPVLLSRFSYSTYRGS